MEESMRPYPLAIAAVAFGPMGFPAPATAEDCSAERFAAAQAIQRSTERLEIELGPYEAAVMSGDLREFDAAARWVVGPWEDLIAVIVRERARLRDASCPLEGIPDEARLPDGWETVRDIGARQMVDADRNFTIHNFELRNSQGLKEDEGNDRGSWSGRASR
jgi:hypothetical protein